VEKPRFDAVGRSSGAQRLSRAVAELPLRYAPFFARLARLWQLPEPLVIEELTRAGDPKSWPVTPFRGVRAFTLKSAGESGGRRSRLLSFASGVRFPRHRHRGSERVLVLEGCYTDGTGSEVGPGQEQHMTEGSEHELTITSRGRCVAAVVEHGIDFSTPWLRWASKFFGAL
jgi:anti-sigma factor ChrR (cupin superfamily)